MPQSDDPIELRKYYRAVSRYHFNVTSIVATLVVTIAWALSPVGFVRANTLQDRIEASVAPLKAEQAQLNAALKELKDVQARDSRRLATSLANGVASEIRFLQSKRCKEVDAEERDRLQREIERKLDEYTELRGSSYQLLRCGEL